MAAVTVLVITKPWWSTLSWSFRRLVAVEAVDALLGVDAQLVLVDDGVLLLGVALGALARRPDEGRGRLLRLGRRAVQVDEKAGQDQAEADDEGDEDRTKGHSPS